jgi:hypothetical protein
LRTHRARLLGAAIILCAAIGATAVGSAAAADDNGIDKKFQEHLVGYAEVPLALSTGGSGDFQARIDDVNKTITYTLSYSDLSAPVTQAHIHFGSVSQAGGISVFLCTNLNNGPAGTQLCPTAPATISGTLMATDVIGPTAQGIAPGEFDKLVAAIRAGVAYVNVHSTQFPGGEIRAQLLHH